MKIESTATLLEPYRNNTYKNKDDLRFHKGKKLFQVYKSMFYYCNSFCSKKKKGPVRKVHCFIVELLLLSHLYICKFLSWLFFSILNVATIGTGK